MGWIDIIFIAIIVVFAIIGLAKGLFESILSIFSTALSIVVAILTSKYVAAFLNNIVHCNDFFAKQIVAWGWVSKDGVTLFNKTFSPEQLANTLTIILSVVAVWLLIKLAIWLLSKLFDNVTTSSSAISGLNRVLGMIFGAAKGFIIGVVALGLVSVVTIFGLGKNIEEQIQKNGMTNFVYKYVNEWVANTLDDKIEDILGKGKTPENNNNQTPENNNENETPENGGTAAAAAYVTEGNVCYILADGR